MKATIQTPLQEYIKAEYARLKKKKSLTGNNSVVKLIKMQDIGRMFALIDLAKHYGLKYK